MRSRIGHNLCWLDFESAFDAFFNSPPRRPQTDDVHTISTRNLSARWACVIRYLLQRYMSGLFRNTSTAAAAVVTLEVCHLRYRLCLKIFLCFIFRPVHVIALFCSNAEYFNKTLVSPKSSTSSREPHQWRYAYALPGVAYGYGH